MAVQIFQLALIPVFILLNGFFAGAELAILTAGRTTLAEMAAKGSRRAEIALSLKDAPERFLPTIQIGITVVGSLASAIGGLTLVAWLELHFAPYVGARLSEPLALVAVVGAISYFSLILGELAPKNLALKYPVAYALVVAYPVHWLERAAMPAVHLLDLSTSFVLAPFGGKLSGASRISREELRNVLLEGHRQGIYSTTERALVHRAIDLINCTVADAAIPRVDTLRAFPGATVGELRGLIAKAPVPYVVLYDPKSDQVHGIVGWREVFTGEPHLAPQVVQRTIYVPESAPLPQALDQMQSANVEAAIVVNEYGEFEGLLPLMHVLQRQILSFSLPQSGHPGISPVSNGWMIQGATPLAALREHLALPLEDSVFYTTMGGFVLEAMGRLPVVGDAFELYGYKFIVERMARTRVDEVKIERA